MFQIKIITCVSAVIAAIVAVGMNCATGDNDVEKLTSSTDDFAVESCETDCETLASETDEILFAYEIGEVVDIVESVLYEIETNPEPIITETEVVEETENEIAAEPETVVAETEIEAVVDVKPTYSEYELDLLARLMTAEMGAYWMPDEAQLYVGSVVLNRVNHVDFPNTLYDVIYQNGQYGPVSNGTIYSPPDERAVKNARYLLENGSILPANVVFQAEFSQGDGVYCQYYDRVLGTTTYFCYVLN